MPSFNQGQFLEAALRSVLLQDYDNIELIVMDGGSTDESVSILQRYDQWITHWQSGRDGGQAEAIRAGFARATGDVFCWLNSDDLLLPGALTEVVQLFDRHPATDFVYGNRVVIDPEDRIVDYHIWPWWITKSHWTVGQPVAQECCFWRRSIYEKVGGVDGSKFFIMDYDLFLRMWLVGRFRKTASFLGCFRIHPASKNSLHVETWQRELRQAIATYGLEVPGFIRSRLVSRVDRLCRQLEWRWTRRDRAAVVRLLTT